VINSRLTNYCGEIGVAKIVSKLIARKDADVFRDPVPWEEYGLTDYLQIVKVPMDLGTVLEKLKKRQYGTLNDCGNVVNLMNKHSNFTSVEPVTSSYDVAQIFHSD
jgi:Bromodomain